MKIWLSIAGLAIAVLALGLFTEQREVSNLRRQNQGLLEQVAQIDSLLDQNARLSNIVARFERENAADDTNFRELLKLRGQVGLLRQEVVRLEANAGQQSNGNAADPELALALGHSKLRYAEELLKAAEAKFAAGVTTQSDFERAQFDFAIAQAELDGNTARATQLRAELAQKNFYRAQLQARAGVITSEELARVRLERDLALAELNPNPIETTRIKLEAAEAKLKAVAARRDAGIVTETELLRAQLNRDMAAAEHQSALKGSQ